MSLGVFGELSRIVRGQATAGPEVRAAHASLVQCAVVAPQSAHALCCNLPAVSARAAAARRA